MYITSLSRRGASLRKVISLTWANRFSTVHGFCGKQRNNHTVELNYLSRPNIAPRFWGGHARRLVTTGSEVLLPIVLAHILWVVAHDTSGVAGIVDGKYALESNGRLFKELTREEYLTHMGAELRSWAAFMIYLYFSPTMYWWLPRTIGPTN